MGWKYGHCRLILILYDVTLLQRHWLLSAEGKIHANDELKYAKQKNIYLF
jgi:hypothetical protein